MSCEDRIDPGKVDGTYIKVAGDWAYLYRAVDSTGETIEFMLSPQRDLMAAKLFMRWLYLAVGLHHGSSMSMSSRARQRDRRAEAVRRTRPALSLPDMPYMNNIIEQDHRFIKKRIMMSLGFRSPEGACRTIEGYESMHAIRKGQIRWVAKVDPVGQCQFIHPIFGVAA